MVFRWVSYVHRGVIAAIADDVLAGTFGMSYSLQSRDLIADCVETVAGGHWLDGMVVVPGCDVSCYRHLACLLLLYVHAD